MSTAIHPGQPICCTRSRICNCRSRCRREQSEPPLTALPSLICLACADLHGPGIEGGCQSADCVFSIRLLRTNGALASFRKISPRGTFDLGRVGRRRSAANVSRFRFRMSGLCQVRNLFRCWSTSGLRLQERLPFRSSCRSSSGTVQEKVAGLSTIYPQNRWAKHHRKPL